MRREEPPPAPVAAPIRWWRLRPWNRNHLMRASDRIEATLLLLTATVVLLLIPIAAAFGTATHTRLEQQTHTLRASMRQVPAVLLEDTYLAPDTPDYAIRSAGTQNTARARWTTPHGERTGAVPTDTPGKAGQTVTISVDADG
ncbi:Rv1733c family protein, partial [Rhodococcus sp. T7]|uniref:Rv1733c family protein n=1 Tax=Rhodococcus sp. T7 TaxID=627444 RepID=UPI0013598CB7